MNYPEQVDRAKGYAVHTIEAINTTTHLSLITVGNLVASYPEYRALRLTGHEIPLSVCLAAASVITATLAATSGKWWVWAAFFSQVAISLGTVWYNDGGINTAWTLITVIVAVTVANHQKIQHLSQRQEKVEDMGMTERLELERIKSQERIAKAQLKAGQTTDNNVDKKMDKQSRQSHLSHLLEEGLTREDIEGMAPDFGVSKKTIRRDMSDIMSNQMSSVHYTNGVHK